MEFWFWVVAACVAVLAGVHVLLDLVERPNNKTKRK